jgi:hypothetical protein
MEIILASGQTVRIELPCGTIIGVNPTASTTAVVNINININITLASAQDRPEGVSENSLIINPTEHGEFGVELLFDISAEQLAEAGLTSDTVRLFYIDDDGNITRGGRIVSRNTDGSVTVGIERASSYVLTEVKIGVLTGGETPEIGDALAILRNTIGLSSILDTSAIARSAALITEDSMEGGKPEIGDALAILRFVIGLSSPLDEFYP